MVKPTIAYEMWRFISKHHKGRARAVPVHVLCTHFGMTDKEVRLAVRGLVMIGYPIGSGNRGYYTIKSKEDLSAAYNMRLRHAIGQLQAARKLKNSQQVNAILGQLSLLEVETRRKEDE